MKKSLAFFSAILFMFVSFIPYASVFATEVEIGNTTYIGTEAEKELGTKIAMLYLVPDLLMNGASDIVIDSSNTSSLDDYLMELYGQISEYSDEGLQTFKDEIDQKANEFVMWAQTYQDPIVDGTLSELFSNDTYITEYHKGNTLGNIGALSRRQSNNGNPNPSPDSNYQVFIDFMNKRSPNHEIQSFWFYDNPEEIVWTGNSRFRYKMNYYPWSSYSYYVPYGNTTDFNKNTYGVQGVCCSNIISIYINSTGNGQYETNISTSYLTNTIRFYNALTDVTNTLSDGIAFLGIYNFATANASASSYHFTGTLDSIFNNLIKYFKNVNIYVDNVPWAIVGQTQSPILGVGGLTCIFNTEQPISYYFSEPVNIDYQKLYELMVRAFQNGEPVDMTTINQGDVFINSNNTTIAPSADLDVNIDNPLDGDFISTLVGVMALPTFNSTMVQPLMNHVGSATVIATTYVSAIPTEIIELLGACLVISLFVCIIHRMLE